MHARSRFLLVEAAQVTVRSQQEWRNKFFHLALRRGRKVASTNLQLERNGALPRVHTDVCSKTCLTPPTLLETGFFASHTDLTRYFRCIILGGCPQCEEYYLPFYFSVLLQSLNPKPRK